MAVGRDPNGKTWCVILDIPATANQRRRQMRRRGFRTESAARAEERATIQRLGAASLAADGTVAVELAGRT